MGTTDRDTRLRGVVMDCSAFALASSTVIGVVGKFLASPDMTRTMCVLPTITANEEMSQKVQKMVAARLRKAGFKVEPAGREPATAIYVSLPADAKGVGHEEVLVSDDHNWTVQDLTPEGLASRVLVRKLTTGIKYAWRILTAEANADGDITLKLSGGFESIAGTAEWSRVVQPVYGPTVLPGDSVFEETAVGDLKFRIADGDVTILPDGRATSMARVGMLALPAD